MIGNISIDLKLRTLYSSRFIVALRINAITTTILIITLPNNHKATSIQACNGRIPLQTNNVSVDLKLKPLGNPRPIIALRVNTKTITILPLALPCNHKAASA